MIWIWVGFLALILLFLALDLGVFRRKAHVVKVKEALAWSIVWAALGMSFGAFVYFGYERHWMGLGLLSPEQKAHAATLAPDQAGSVFVDKWAVSADNPHGRAQSEIAMGGSEHDEPFLHHLDIPPISAAGHDVCRSAEVATELAVRRRVSFRALAVCGR